jgi:hypothetical protein
MKVFSLFLRQLVAGAVLLAASATASVDVLRDYLWTNRVIITFSTSESTPERLLLIKQIAQYPCEFRKRDLVHIDLISGSVDYQSLSQRFAMEGKDFKLVLIGKDGKIKLLTTAVALEDIFALIDTMPMRKKEMRGEKCQ